MTNHEDDDDKENDTENDEDKSRTVTEWEFSNLKPTQKSAQSTDDSQVKKKKFSSLKNQPLKLDEGQLPRATTRSEMALKMQNEVEVQIGDIYDCAPLYKRAIAFIIDSLLLVIIYFLVNITAPLWRFIIQYFLDSYKLQFLISEALVMKGIRLFSGFMAFILFVIIPISFFNRSLGKKILGLSVRGEDKYSISITQALLRELIMKPISLLIIAGLVTPFFSKRKLSIHDMASRTIVIED